MKAALVLALLALAACGVEGPPVPPSEAAQQTP
ncbi:lipoprotein [Thioclava sp. GXIMD4216]|uniref:Lipoprotein n=1 Tax=Thioclava litoralis TaxID=3076557 RepID=A0ABZ1E302_9RHOB|nr:lipoprotein [Thioclava sp. FTW29]